MTAMPELIPEHMTLLEINILVVPFSVARQPAHTVPVWPVGVQIPRPSPKKWKRPQQMWKL